MTLCDEHISVLCKGKFSNVSFSFSIYIKLQSDVLREAITQISTDAKEKKRNFIETVELQIGLKNYDPQKDKRFSGLVKLPHIPRPKMKVCMLVDAQHIGEGLILQDEVCYTGTYIAR
ncbi:60S ribosomal protein L10a-2-like [Impatiens glandulifera]|uniref:60S ribosomal protein L10a-2-like n=1 Tax=Impatiens glandulifera TaxID=253017 RepID=UPI001FB0B383|nr:60S ribosomal protein L10a-2-like [Impatiens glandulifera]